MDEYDSTDFVMEEEDMTLAKLLKIMVLDDKQMNDKQKIVKINQLVNMALEKEEKFNKDKEEKNK